ncbi:MAG: acyltransferase [Firmicutes bacterium]|nr:acyltransferase [Bacillota bacterium]
MATAGKSTTGKAVSPQNTATSSQRWLVEIEVIRGLAALSVVVIHSVDDNDVTPFLDGLRRALLVSVPLFFLMSSFLSFYKYPLGAPKGYFRSRLKRLGIPYLFWALLFSVLHPWMQNGQLPGWATVLHGLLRGPFQLYFLVVLLQFEFLFTLTHWQIFRHWLLHPLALALATVIDMGSVLFFDNYHRQWWPDFFDGAQSWLLFFVLGAWLAAYWPSIQRILSQPRVRLAALAAALSAVLLVQDGLHHVAAYEPRVQASALLVFPLLVQVAQLARERVITLIARHSFGLYLAHPLPWMVLSNFYDFLPAYPYFLLTLALDLGFGLGVSKALGHRRVFRWLVGMGK